MKESCKIQHTIMKTSIALDKHCAIGAERDTSNNVDETLPSKRVATMFTVFVIVPNRANALVVVLAFRRCCTVGVEDRGIGEKDSP